MKTESIFEQFANISKAHAYDIVAQQRNELMDENAKLKSENETLKIELKAANSLLSAYKAFVNDTRPTNAVSAALPVPKESENDLKDIPVFTNNINDIT